MLRFTIRGATARGPTPRSRSVIRAISICVFCAVASHCDGAVIPLSASLSGADARPQNVAPGFGSAIATMDDATGIFTISGTSRSFRPAVEISIRGPNNPPADVTGPLILSLSFTTGPASEGAGFDSSFSGSAGLDSTEMADLLAGHYFVAVHTSLAGFDGPDLGGSLTVPEPRVFAMVCLAALALLRRHRDSGARRA
jgi:hypothetical protein